MRKFNQVVFDEVIYAGTDTGHGTFTGTFYTRDTYDYLLGECDQLALQAITDNVTGTATSILLSIAIETSCDERHWVQKINGTAEISAFLNSADTTRLPWGSDDGQLPSYAFVRLRIYMTCTANAASVHLVIHATGRDSGGTTARAAKQSIYHGIPPRKLTTEEVAKAWWNNCIQHTNPRDCSEMYDKKGYE